MKRRLILFVVILALQLGSVTAQHGVLEIFSWWAGDEGPALEALTALYDSRHPEIEVINATVTGGAGVNFRAVLKTRMLGGNPPDSFQVHAGQELIGTWVIANRMQDLTWLYEEEGWFDVFPQGLIDQLSYEGSIYSVPVNIHRAGVMWYIPHYLDTWGVSIPATRDEFYEVCTDLQSRGITPLVVVNTSLKNPAAINLATTWHLREHIYWQSYAEAIEELGPRIWNSITLVTNATLLSAIIGSLNGYVLSKWRIAGERVLFPLILLGMFIPYQGILIPLFEFMRDARLYGGIPGLIIILAIYGLPITTLIFRNFYAEIPDEMLEAAAIDGAGFWDIYTQIVFPLSISGFVVVIIWQFTQIWNEFLFAVTMTTGASEPITVGLAQLAGGEAVQWNLPMAGAVVAMLPPITIYLILSRYFVRGLLAGSIKS